MTPSDYQASTLLVLVLVAGVGCVLLASVLERFLGWWLSPNDDRDQSG